LKADFHLKEEVVARYNFFEELDPSGHIEGASSVTWYKAVYRPWGRPGGAEHQSMFGRFFISCTHCLWDVVGILLGRVKQVGNASNISGLSDVDKNCRQT